MNSNFHYPSPRGAFGHIEKACLQIKIQLKAALSSRKNDSTDNCDQDKYPQKHEYPGFMIDL